MLPHGIKSAVSKAHHQPKFSGWYGKKKKIYLISATFNIFNIIYLKLWHLTYHNDSYSSSYISNNCDGWFFLGNQHWSMANFFREVERRNKEKVYTIYLKCGNANFGWVTERSEATMISTITALLGKNSRILTRFFFKLCQNINYIYLHPNS